MPSAVEWASKVAQSFEYNEKDVRRATKRFVSQLEDGLENQDATLNQIPSYVTSRPTGKETGLYLAADLGGTNLRICSVDLHGNSTYTLQQSKASIPISLMTASSITDLFGYLAAQLELFLKQHHPELLHEHQTKIFEKHGKAPNDTTSSNQHQNSLKLGFTFSFAFDQTSLNRGVLKYWTKGFSIPNSIGLDICSLFQVEIDRISLPVQLVALVNDTVGTLLARSYTSPYEDEKTIIGAVFGTGTNGAYVEKRRKITKLDVGNQGQENTEMNEEEEMILNTEWGSFDNEMEVLRSTEWDKRVDEESLHPGIQIFEKMVSGMYLGEILRHVLISMMAANPLFLSRPTKTTTTEAADSPDRLNQQFAIDSSFLSLAATDSGDFLLIREELKKVFDLDANVESAEAVKVLALAIGRRAARLAGVAIAGCIIQSSTLHPTSRFNHPQGTISGNEEKEMTIVKESKEEQREQIASSSDPKLKFHQFFHRLAKALCLSSGDQSRPMANKSLQTKEDPVSPSPSLPSSPSSSSSASTKLDFIDIGIDGSLYEYYPLWEEMIRETLREVEEIGIEGEKRIKMGISQDGSGVGAALAARMAGQTSLVNSY